MRFFEQAGNPAREKGVFFDLLGCWWEGKEHSFNSFQVAKQDKMQEVQRVEDARLAQRMPLSMVARAFVEDWRERRGMAARCSRFLVAWDG